MVETLFVDTGAWYAIADRSDRHHHQAVQFYPEALRDHHHLTTTNLVVAETYTLIRRALGHAPAVTFLEKTAASPRIRRIYTDRALDDTAEEILKRFHDQNFSYTDAASFAVMQHYGIKQAFAFDQHFATAGFTVIPAAANDS